MQIMHIRLSKLAETYKDTNNLDKFEDKIQVKWKSFDTVVTFLYFFSNFISLLPLNNIQRIFQQHFSLRSNIRFCREIFVRIKRLSLVFLFAKGLFQYQTQYRNFILLIICIYVKLITKDDSKISYSRFGGRNKLAFKRAEKHS